MKGQHFYDTKAGHSRYADTKTISFDSLYEVIPHGSASNFTVTCVNHLIYEIMDDDKILSLNTIDQTEIYMSALQCHLFTSRLELLSTCIAIASAS